MDIVESLLIILFNESIKEILKDIYDLERLSSRIAFGNINARDASGLAVP
ncbi:MAG: hypothetical protein ACLRQF_20325 [Thomasclavelia ramosa]